MDDQQVGRFVRTLRRRRGWRQIDVAHAAGCSQNMVSLVERGHLDRVSLRFVRRLLAVVDASVALDVRWRGAAVDRIVDEEHAVLVGGTAALLRAFGWLVEIEVTYSEFGERGSYDLIAFHPQSRALLVVEVKTELASAEATLRKLDEKTRLAGKVAHDRFGWLASSVSRVLVLPASASSRRRIARHENVFGRALPARTVAVRRWLNQPAATINGIWFLADRDSQVGIRRPPAKERVWRPIPRSGNRSVAA